MPPGALYFFHSTGDNDVQKLPSSTRTTSSAPERGERIEHRARFDLIRYSNCWEDADVLCDALEPRPGQRVLSIASAGDNVLALLAEGAEVVAADLSEAQLACLELRCAAFRNLEYDGVLRFLGVRAATNRTSTFAQLQTDLSPAARSFWHRRLSEIDRGIIHAGRFEAYFRLFRQRIVPLVHARRTIERLLDAKTESSRRTFYDHVWDNWRWRLLFRIFFSRYVMGRMGRDPEFFRYVKGSVWDRILARTKYAVTTLPTHNNPFLEYILTGNFSRSLPRYLEPERFEAVRRGLDRLTLFHGSIERAGQAHSAAGFDAFNLSDIFEYMDMPSSRAIYEDLLAVAKPGARLAYWNTLVPRCAPAELAGRVRPLTEKSRGLLARDRAFFYCDFMLDEVIEGT